jgi:hypothetical protein
VVADGESLQIPQALAASEDTQHRHQLQVPGEKAHAAPHSRIWDRPQVTDQVEIGCGRGAFENKEEAIPPTPAHADRPGKGPWCRL